jgi:hypothetical protein
VTTTHRPTRSSPSPGGELGMSSLPDQSSRPRDADARGAQGVLVGKSNIQVNIYAEARSRVWPHQVGSVPLLADCYQRREQQAARLDALTTPTVVLTQVLSGLGGVGKTQLAANYARRVWAQRGVELLVWATASSRAPGHPDPKHHHPRPHHLRQDHRPYPHPAARLRTHRRPHPADPEVVRAKPPSPAKPQINRDNTVQDHESSG